jgi:hypothetical protein
LLPAFEATNPGAEFRFPIGGSAGSGGTMVSENLEFSFDFGMVKAFLFCKIQCGGAGHPRRWEEGEDGVSRSSPDRFRFFWN